MVAVYSKRLDAGDSILFFFNLSLTSCARNLSVSGRQGVYGIDPVHLPCHVHQLIDDPSTPVEFKIIAGNFPGHGFHCVQRLVPPVRGHKRLDQTGQQPAENHFSFLNSADLIFIRLVKKEDRVQGSRRWRNQGNVSMAPGAVSHKFTGHFPDYISVVAENFSSILQHFGNGRLSRIGMAYEEQALSV